MVQKRQAHLERVRHRVAVLEMRLRRHGVLVEIETLTLGEGRRTAYRLVLSVQENIWKVLARPSPGDVSACCGEIELSDNGTLDRGRQQMSEGLDHSPAAQQVLEVKKEELAVPKQALVTP